jgi:hypothetical protein
VNVKQSWTREWFELKKLFDFLIPFYMKNN